MIWNGKPSYHWVRLSFVHAIHEAQKEIHQGVRLNIPTLLMHAHKTTYPLRFNRNAQTSDVILQVRDMIEHAQKIQGDVQLCSIQNGVHDLVLSENRFVSRSISSYFNGWKIKPYKPDE